MSSTEFVPPRAPPSVQERLASDRKQNHAEAKKVTDKLQALKLVLQSIEYDITEEINKKPRDRKKIAALRGQHRDVTRQISKKEYLQDRAEARETEAEYAAEEAAEKEEAAENQRVSGKERKPSE